MVRTQSLWTTTSTFIMILHMGNQWLCEEVVPVPRLLSCSFEATLNATEGGRVEKKGALSRSRQCPVTCHMSHVTPRQVPSASLSTPSASPIGFNLEVIESAPQAADQYSSTILHSFHVGRLPFLVTTLVRQLRLRRARLRAAGGYYCNPRTNMSTVLHIHPAFQLFVHFYRHIGIKIGILVSTMCLKKPEAVPLYYAAMLGFHGLAKHLITEHPEQINLRAGWRRLRFMSQQQKDTPTF